MVDEDGEGSLGGKGRLGWRDEKRGRGRGTGFAGTTWVRDEVGKRTRRRKIVGRLRHGRAVWERDEEGKGGTGNGRDRIRKYRVSEGQQIEGSDSL